MQSKIMHCVSDRQREACLIIKRSIINSSVLNLNWYLSWKPPKDKQYIKWWEPHQTGFRQNYLKLVHMACHEKRTRPHSVSIWYLN